MPTIKLTKNAIDALRPNARDAVYWDAGLPGFGLKATPRRRKVFIVLYRVRDGRSRLRKYTIVTYGRLTLHQAREAAQRVFAARLDGRDPAAEKLELRRRAVVDRVDELLEAYAAEHLSKLRSGTEVGQMLRRALLSSWGHPSIHDLKRRDISELVSEVAQRSPSSAHKLLKSLKHFLGWCMGKAIVESSAADGLRSGHREVPRDRVLDDMELVRVLRAARALDDVFGGIVEFLALTGQRREEVNRMTWEEVDLDARTWTIPSTRSKNGRRHTVHLSRSAVQILKNRPRSGPFLFSDTRCPFQRFSQYKSRLDATSTVSGWVIHDLRRTCVSGIAAKSRIDGHTANVALHH